MSGKVMYTVNVFIAKYIDHYKNHIGMEGVDTYIGMKKGQFWTSCPNASPVKHKQMEQRIKGTYRGIQPGDKITARLPSYWDGNKVVGTGDTYEGWLTVTKAFSHGARTKERGYVNHNRIVNVLRQTDGDSTAT